MSTEGSTHQTFDKLSRDQLEIYAKELREHIQTERRLRQELEGRNSDLEQRVREITALNQLFQQHLDERTSVVKAYREIIDGLAMLADQFSDLAERARAQPLPDLESVPTLPDDDTAAT